MKPNRNFLDVLDNTNYSASLALVFWFDLGNWTQDEASSHTLNNNNNNNRFNHTHNLQEKMKITLKSVSLKIVLILDKCYLDSLAV